MRRGKLGAAVELGDGKGYPPDEKGILGRVYLNRCVVGDKEVSELY